ncbi:MAG: hypothetical protein HYU02_05485 [Thaumarchaeota archaeon]|nr:hypothetical protein [Nitrososphaerota archaeon]
MSSQEIKIPNSKIESSQSSRVSIQRAVVGQIRIDQVTLNGFKGNFNYNSGMMSNTQIKIVIKPYLDYWWGVCIGLPWPFDDVCVGDDGSVSFGTIDMGWSNLGNVSIAGGQLLLDVAQTTFGPFNMTPLPLGGKDQPITAASVQTNDIRMEDTSMSTGLPSVLGLDLPVPNPMGPQSVNIKKTTIAQLLTEGMRIPPMGFTGIDAKNVKMDKAESGGFQAQGTFTKSTSWLNLTFVGFRLRFEITSILKASKITMNGLSGNVQVQSALTSAFNMSLNLSGIEINGLKINKFQVPAIVLEV